MEGVISIFALPAEVKELHRLVRQLRDSSYYLEQDIHLTVDLAVCLSGELTDWSESVCTKDSIRNYVTKLCSKYLSNYYTVNVDFCLNNQVLGCVSQRRYSLESHPKADFFIWLDCDMVFDMYAICFLVESYRNTKGLTVITPQIVRQWDTTWDCLVHRNYIQHPINFYKICDIKKEIDKKARYEDVHTTLSTLYKFAGGWCTLIAGDLLRMVQVPKSFGHYGLEDTFLMCCMNHIPEARQVIVNNVLVGSDEKYKHLWKTKGIKTKARKLEFLKIAQDNFNIELSRFVRSMV